MEEDGDDVLLGACTRALCIAALLCTCSSSRVEDEEETESIYFGEGEKIIPSNGLISVKQIRKFYGSTSGIILSLEPILKSMDRPLSEKGRRRPWSSATLKVSPARLGWYKIDYVVW